MSSCLIYQEIRNKLINYVPDEFSKIELIRNSKDEYPEETHSLIFNSLKNDLELLNAFEEQVKLSSNPKDIYDSIFYIQSDYEKEFIEEEEEEEYQEEEPFIIDYEYSESEPEPTKPVEPVEIQKPKQDDSAIDIESFLSIHIKCTKDVADKLSISNDAAYLLLKKFDWNCDKLFEWSTQNDKLTDWFKMISPLNVENIGKGCCPICLCDENDLYRFYCGHSACFECVKEDIQYQIDNQNYPVVCRIDNCSKEILPSCIEYFLGKEKADQYQLRYIEYQMSLNEELIKCSSPNCNNFLKRHSSNLCNVCKCKCGHRMCSECRKEAHAPLTCQQLENWKKIQNEMIQLELQQRDWKDRENKLWEYRKQNIDEVQNAFKALKKQLEEEHEEANKREIEEINEIKSRMANETNEGVLHNLKLKLNDRESVHNYKKIERNHEKDNFFEDKNYIQRMENMRRLNICENKPNINEKRINRKPKIKYERAETHNCPKCNALIVKDGGCNHMACQHCNHQFCWICLKDWSTHNYKNYFMCPYDKSNKTKINDNDINQKAGNNTDAINENNNDSNNESQDINENNNHNNNTNESQNINENNNNNSNDQSSNFILIPKKIRKNNKLRRQNRNQLRNRNPYTNYDDYMHANYDDYMHANNSDYNPSNINDHFNFNEYEYEYEEDTNNIDHTFSLPPIDPKTRVIYSRWLKCNEKIERIERIPDKYSDVSPYIKNSIHLAASILINSYKLLFILEKGTFIHNVIDYYSNLLESFFYKIGIYDTQPEVADALYKTSENLLISANVMNF